MADPLEVVSSRSFDAPRERVYEAVVDPKQLEQWWGPKGFTNVFQRCEPKPGGAWEFVMRGPDGAEYPNESQFLELRPPERVVIEHLRPMHRFTLVMQLVDLGGRTQVTWTMRFDSEQEVQRVGKYVEEGNEQNFDRLAAHLAKG